MNIWNWLFPSYKPIQDSDFVIIEQSQVSTVAKKRLERLEKEKGRLQFRELRCIPQNPLISSAMIDEKRSADDLVRTYHYFDTHRFLPLHLFSDARLITLDSKIEILCPTQTLKDDHRCGENCILVAEGEQIQWRNAAQEPITLSSKIISAPNWMRRVHQAVDGQTEFLLKVIQFANQTIFNTMYFHICEEFKRQWNLNLHKGENFFRSIQLVMDRERKMILTMNGSMPYAETKDQIYECKGRECFGNFAVRMIINLQTNGVLVQTHIHINRDVIKKRIQPQI